MTSTPSTKRSRAEVLLNELREHDDGRCACVRLTECDAARLAAIERTLASVEQDARKRKCIECGSWITDGDYDLCRACEERTA